MTRPRPRSLAAWWSIGALAGAFALGCSGQSGYAGLANVPNPNRPWSPDDQGRDVVANGTESCAPSGRSADDPLRNRIPPCPEATPVTKARAASSAAKPAAARTPAGPYAR